MGGMEKKSEEFFPFSVTVSLTLGHIFSSCDVFRCVFVLAAAFPSSRILLLMSQSSLLRLRVCHAQTTHVTYQLNRKCVSFNNSPAVSH